MGKVSKCVSRIRDEGVLRKKNRSVSWIYTLHACWLPSGLSFGLKLRFWERNLKLMRDQQQKREPKKQIISRNNNFQRKNLTIGIDLHLSNTYKKKTVTMIKNGDLRIKQQPVSRESEKSEKSQSCVRWCVWAFHVVADVCFCST